MQQAGLLLTDVQQGLGDAVYGVCNNCEAQRRCGEPALCTTDEVMGRP